MLRKYQENAIDFIHKNSDSNVCVQLPTGTGKTVIISQLVSENVFSEKKTLIIAPSRELVDNITSRINAGSVFGAYSGNVPSKSILRHLDTLVVTYQSIKNYFKIFIPDVIISDEAHLSMCPTWTNAIAQYRKLNPQIIHIGFTATPNRLDGRGLFNHYKYLFEAPQISWFIDNGYLSDFDLYAQQNQFLTATINDSLDQQESLYLPELESIFKHWQEKAGNCKTIIFVPTINFGEKLEKVFQDAGYLAKFLSSKTESEEREFRFNQFKKGQIQVLINVQLFTLGVDIPDCECVVLSRFTFSTALYLQMVGRLLRPVPGVKKILIDLVNNVYYHGSPKTQFYWDLKGDEKVPKDNRNSTSVVCECGNKLCLKKFVICATEISCLKCKKTTFAMPVDSSPRKGSKAVENIFSIEELHLLKDHKLTEFTRLIQTNKVKKEKKIRKIIEFNFEGIHGVKFKVKALKHIGLSDKEIEDYIDVEYWEIV